jgi:hypothetical protein
MTARRLSKVAHSEPAVATATRAAGSGERACLGLCQQLRQLGDIDRNPARLVFRQAQGWRRVPRTHRQVTSGRFIQP